MQKPSLLRRIGIALFTLLLVTLGLFDAVVLRTVQRLLNEGARQHVDAAAGLLQPTVASLLAQGAHAEIARLCGSVGTLTRVTVLLPDGTVIGESMAEPGSMDNHLDRPEVKEAAATGVGINTRYSHSVHAYFVYLAHRIDGPDGSALGFLRVAAPTAVYDRARREAMRRLLVALALLLPFAAVVAYRLMLQLTKPLTDMRHSAERFAAGDFATPVRTSHSREIDALATCLNVMSEQLDARLREVTRQRNETDAILRGMSEGVVATDAQLRVLRMNRAAAELLGVDAAEARGRKLIEVVRNAALHDTLQDALSHGTPMEREAILLADAGEITVDIHASRLPDASGSVAVLHDTTRMRRLESMRRDFVANVSHELRTPITAILGFVETLADGAIDDPRVARRFLATIQRHSERLGRIVEDLLLLSKLDSQSGGTPLDMVREQVRAADLVRDATQTLEALASERGTRIEAQVDADIAFDVFPRFAQPALANLVDNAVKYSPPGATIRIVVTQTEAATRIAVTDQGPGIPAEHRTRIFERFYRVDKGRSRELGGTGLGLAIVKHVMSVHGGSVELSSEEGRGSTFTLVFPRHVGHVG